MTPLYIRTQFNRANPAHIKRDHFRRVFDRKFMQSKNGDIFMIEMRSVYDWNIKDTLYHYCISRLTFIGRGYRLKECTQVVEAKGYCSHAVEFLDAMEKDNA